MSRSTWKQALQRDNQERFGQYYESVEPYDLMQTLIDVCDAHLHRSSLEYLASTSEEADSVPHDAPLLLTQGPSKTRDQLLELFLREFRDYNETRRDLLPNRNELMFMALMQYHYCTQGRKRHWAKNEPVLRLEFAETVYRDFLDSRARLAAAMCRHGHVVHGEPYETRRARAERRRENRMDFQCPAHYTFAQWHELRKKQQEEDAAEAAADRAVAERIQRVADKRRRQFHQEDDDEEEEVGSLYPIDPSEEDVGALPHLDLLSLESTNNQTWPEPAPFPASDHLLDEVAFFVTCYLVTVGVKVAPEGVDVSPEVAQVRKRLTNAAEGNGMGMLWTVDANASLLYLQMATQFYAQVWTERRWRDQCPTEHVEQLDLRSFYGLVASKMDTEIQEGQVKELSYNIYSLLLPIGARGLAKRVWGGTGSSMRVLLNKMCGSGVIHEIDELFDTQATVKLVGYDVNHPLQDALCMMVVQGACYDHDNEFSMVSRCIASPDKPAVQGPAIVKLCGEWLVISGKTWYKPPPPLNSFAAIWLVFLGVLKRKHDFSMDSMSNLSYWETTLRCTL